MTRPGNLFTSKITLKTRKNTAERSKYIITMIRTRICWWLLNVVMLWWFLRMRGVQEMLSARGPRSNWQVRGIELRVAQTLSRAHRADWAGCQDPGPICILGVVTLSGLLVEHLHHLIPATAMHHKPPATNIIIRERHVIFCRLRHSSPLSAPDARLLQIQKKPVWSFRDNVRKITKLT